MTYIASMEILEILKEIRLPALGTMEMGTLKMEEKEYIAFSVEDREGNRAVYPMFESFAQTLQGVEINGTTILY